MEQNAVELSLFERAWTWFEANKKLVAWGAGVVVIAGFIGAFYFWRQGENEVAASEALSHADAGRVVEGVKRNGSPETFLKVAAEYPGTAAAGRALLQAAAALFAEEKYSEAQAQFERFSREYSSSPFLPQARLGVAACLDAQGKTADAMSAYEDLARKYPSANVAPQAEFALARIYESQGKLEQAWSLYEKLAQQLGLNDSMGSEAGIRAEELKAKLPAASTSPSPAATAVPQISFPTPSVPTTNKP